VALRAADTVEIDEPGFIAQAVKFAGVGEQRIFAAGVPGEEQDHRLALLPRNAPGLQLQAVEAGKAERFVIEMAVCRGQAIHRPRQGERAEEEPRLVPSGHRHVNVRALGIWHVMSHATGGEISRAIDEHAACEQDERRENPNAAAECTRGRMSRNGSSVRHGRECGRLAQNGVAR